MSKVKAMARVSAEAQSKRYGSLKGTYRFRFRSWEVVTIFFTLLFGFFILTGVTDTEQPLSVRLVIGLMGGSLWLWGFGLLMRRLVRGRNIVTIYERGMIVSNRKTGTALRSFAWTDVSVIREHGHAASFHQGNQVADASNRVWFTLHNGNTLKFINTLTDMETFSFLVRRCVGEAQKADLFAEWENSGKLRTGGLLLTKIGLTQQRHLGTTTVEWSQVLSYTCGTEALEFIVPTGKSNRMIKISWSKLPNLGALDMLIKHILSERGR